MMKKFSLINALVEKSTSRNGQNRRVERARALRLENLESRELLSVAPGNEIFALTADEVAVYEAKAAERADDVIDLSGAQLDGAEGGLDPIVVTSEADVVDGEDDVVTLREAISFAQPGGTITFDASLQGKTIALQFGQLTVNKSITIDASNLLDETTNVPGLTISGEGTSRTLRVEGASDVEITGIAFTNGYVEGAGSGGAISIVNSTASFSNCVISGSKACDGGGVAFDGGEATLTNCSITNNEATGTFGGGIYALNGTLTLVDCSVTNNTSKFGGGGIFNSGATFSLDHCEVSGNKGYAGAFDLRSGAMTFVNSTITNNSGKTNGGVLFNAGGTASFENCAIYGNTAREGGALYLSQGDTTLVNCTVTKNTASAGGAVSSYLAGNAAALNVYNSIIVENSASTGSDVYASQSAAAYSKAYNTLSGYAEWGAGGNNYVYSNSRPLFNDSSADNFTLAMSSQAHDRGDNQYLTVSVDLADKPRISGDTVDLGAYEFQKIPLTTPAYPRETGRTSSTIDLAWTGVVNAVGYQLAWMDEDDTEFTYVPLDASTTTYTLEGLSPASNYYWMVQALGDGVNYLDSMYTAIRSAATLDRLDPPANPTETAKSETSITVGWDAVQNAAGYKVIWKQDSESEYHSEAQVAASTTSYTIEGLDNGATYEWSVQALGDDVSFADSVFTAARTVVPRQVLAAPANPTETAKTETTITVAWDAVQNASGYQIGWKRLSDFNYTYVNISDASTTSYALDGLDAGATYEWKVQARGDSFDYSDSVFTTPRSVVLRQVLATPANPTETAKTETSVTVAWNAVEHTNGYQLAWKSTSDFNYNYVNIPASTNFYMIEGLDNAKTYEWKVLARGDGFDYSDSEFTTPRTVVPRRALDAPVFSGEEATPTTVSVSWDAVANAAGYSVSYKLASETEWSSEFDAGTNLSYSISGLEPTTEYVVRVRALGDGVDYTDSDYSTTSITTTETPSILVTTPNDVVSETDGEISLREALQYAAAGDTITFAESLRGQTITLENGELNIDKAITIDASNLYDATTSTPGVTIDGQRKSRIFYVEGGFDAEIIGLRLTKGYSGYSEHGGAIHAEIATLFVEDCIICSNSADYNGGGVYLRNAEATFTNCFIVDNYAGNIGGGVYENNATVGFVACSIEGNESISNGGGVYLIGGDATFENSVFTWNVAGCIEDEFGEDDSSRVPSLEEQGSRGGAIYNDGATLSLVNSAFSMNRAYRGGAFAGSKGETTLSNCTVTNNTARGVGGGIHQDGLAVFKAYNTIVCGNTGTTDADVYVYGSDAVATAYNTLSSYSAWTSGENNLIYDESLPLFTDASKRDYTLAMDSQAIDQGDNQYVTASVDLAGKARIDGAAVDLGAYEFQKIRLDRPVLTLEAKTKRTLSVSWEPVANAVRYSLSYKLASETTWKNVNVGTNLDYTIEGLEKNTKYDVRLKAISEGATYKSIYSLVLHTGTDESPVPLDAPTATVDRAPTFLVVDWELVANAVGYSVAYKPADGTDWTEVDGGSEFTYTINGLDPNTAYDVRVKAVGDGVEYGDVYSETILVETTDTIPGLDTPNASASAKTAKTITAAWDAVPNASGYRFAWKNQEDVTFTFVTLDAETTSYELTKLDGDATFCWKVLALGDEVEYYNSAYSELQIDQPRQVIVKPVVTVAVEGNSLTLSWEAVANADRYSVAYKLASESEWKRFNAKTELSYTFSDLEENADYEIQIKAIGDGVDYKSIYSDVVQARTDAASSAMLELADEVFDELDEEDFDLLALNALIG